MDLDLAFIKMMTFVNKFYDQSIDIKIQESILDFKNISDLIQSIEDVIPLIKNLSDNDKQLFIERYLKKLLFFRNVIGSCENNYFSKYYDLKTKSKLSRYYNQIIIPLNFNKTYEIKTKLITNIFTNFVKGITYFESEFQQSRYPIYHRNASCGSTNQTSDEKFIKTLYGPDKSLYVRRCYIERKIYDIIYKRFFNYQDIGHLHELKIVEQYYDTYFPNENLKIKLIFDPIKTLYPFILKLETSDYIEEYHRRLLPDDTYYSNVICTQKIIKTNQRLTKVQTFEKPSEWV